MSEIKPPSESKQLPRWKRADSLHMAMAVIFVGLAVWSLVKGRDDIAVLLLLVIATIHHVASSLLSALKWLADNREPSATRPGDEP